MQVRGNAFVPHRLHHLDHACQSGGRLEMPEIRLDGSHEAGCAGFAPNFLDQRFQLDRVTHRRAGAMRFDVRHARR